MQNYGLLGVDLRKYTGRNPELEIVYIMPANKENRPNVIDFNTFADFLDKAASENNSFEKTLAEALRFWKVD
jgi:hypothetical protein